MFKLQTIVVLICATSVLTSSVTKTATGGSSNETRVDPVVHLHSSSKLTNKSDTNLLTDDTHPTPLMGVGAQIHRPESSNTSSIVTKTAPQATVVAEGITLISDDLAGSDSKSKLPKIRTASVVARKGAPSKILPRKGVVLESSGLAESYIEGIDEAVHSVHSSVDKASKKVEQFTAKIDAKNDTKKVTIEPTLATKIISAVSSSANDTHTMTRINSTTLSTLEGVVSTAETKIAELRSSALPPKRFKPKPTVTIGEMDIDKPIPASPTKTPPLGMPQKIDYIVPVMITIMALPLLGAVAFFLYRRGRDCWDKRHYRRMDFLIDGMYNDYSWK